MCRCWAYVCVSVGCVGVGSVCVSVACVCVSTELICPLVCVHAALLPPPIPPRAPSGRKSGGASSDPALSPDPQCPWGLVCQSWRLHPPPSPLPHPSLSLTGTRVNKCCFSPILLRPVMENPRAGSEPRIDSPFHLTGWLSP